MKKIIAAVRSFSLSAKAILLCLAIVFCLSGLSLLWRLNNRFLVAVPVAGGSLREGVVGLPDFINPVLADTATDKDLTELVYSGLIRYDSKGNIVPDLALSYSVSPDGLTYTFTLRKNAVWSDGKPVTADDVVFTIEKIQDPAIQSPLASNWQGVTVKKINEDQVEFILKQPYAGFIENAAVGILPSHLWQNVTDSEFSSSPMNARPVGSGPYEINSIEEDSAGVPTEYSLVPFKNFVLGKALIQDLTFQFYSTEADAVAAYQSGDVDELNSISPETAWTLENGGAIVATSTLPRVFGVFFNQNQNPALADAAVRQALDLSVNRQYIVNTVLWGFGEPLLGPAPTDFFNLPNATSSGSTGQNVAEANEILNNAGWRLSTTTGVREKTIGKEVVPLTFSLSVPDVVELKNAANILESEWQTIGARVNVQVFDNGDFDESVLKPRQYDAVLFGEVENRGLDLYPFWASSQTTDPGLNIAGYSNPQADKILAALRIASNESERVALYEEFAEEIENDRPAVLLYAPDFVYIFRNPIHTDLGDLTDPSERFENVYQWYLNQEKIWKIFTKYIKTQP